MILAYGVWRYEKQNSKGGRKKTVTHNDTIDIGDLSIFDNGPEIRKLIRDKHPGWSIVGYGPTDDRPAE